MRAFLALGGCVFGIAAAACAPTDTGNPPFAIDVTTLSGVLDDMPGADALALSVTAAAGTVDPPLGEAVLRRVDSGTEVARAPVRADGGFDLVAVVYEGLYRLMVEDGDAPSDVIEIAVTPTDVTFSRVPDS